MNWKAQDLRPAASGLYVMLYNNSKALCFHLFNRIRVVSDILFLRVVKRAKWDNVEWDLKGSKCCWEILLLFTGVIYESWQRSITDQQIMYCSRGVNSVFSLRNCLFYCFHKKLLSLEVCKISLGKHNLSLGPDSIGRRLMPSFKCVLVVWALELRRAIG